MARRKVPDTQNAIVLVIWLFVIVFVGIYHALKWIIVFIASIFVGRKRANEAAHKQLEAIDYMSGTEFECFFADLLRYHGYKNVKTTPGSGDYGVDVVADKDGTRYAFQCKCYQSSVGVSAVQEVYSGAAMYKATEPVVVTNSHFTPNAVTLAGQLHVSLWDRNRLAQMLVHESQQKKTEPPPLLPVAEQAESLTEQAEEHIETEPLVEISKGDAEMATVLRAGRYTFGKNIPNGVYDLTVLSGSGSVDFEYKDKNKWHNSVELGLSTKREAKSYYGIDSDIVKCFSLEGNVEVQITKSKMIEIED